MGTLDRLKKVTYTNISEWDFYQFLSEAIVAGRPDSGMNPEITAGLQRTDPRGVENPPPWSRNPRFHTLRLITGAGDSVADGEKDDSSVRSRLAEMTDKADVHNVVLEGLIANLCSRLNMNPDQHGITSDTSIVELGVDSLLAVDMRAWFTKELDVDMPVLKLLGGATVAELVEDAISRLAPALVPKLAQDSDKPADDGNKGQTATTTEEKALEDPINNKPAPSIEINKPVEELEEEPLRIAPLDLPSFDDPAEDALTNPRARLPITRANSTSSSASSSPADGSEDSAQATGTSATSDSEADFDDSKEEFGEDGTFCDEINGSNAEAKLFSHLPDRVENPLEFMKKVKMSYGSSRFWFLMQYLQDPTTFNLVCNVKCSGPTRYDDADRCVVELGNRHEIFRTAFFADPEHMNEPTMGVLEETALRLERRRAGSPADVDAEFDELLNYQFKLEQGETIRIKMVSLDDKTHHMLFGFHHIAMDGFSFNVLLSEINMLYDRQPLPPVRTQFSDFATRQRRQVMDGSLDGDFQYWKDMYSTKLPSGEVKPDFLEPLPLFNLAQSSRKSLDNYEFEQSFQVLDARTVRQVKAQCRRHKITTFHFFLGVLRTYLFRHLDVDDLVIGIADANRSDSTLDGTMGFMLNLLPLRFKNEVGDKHAPFKDIATDARSKAYDALAHSKLPFDALLEKLDMPRSTTHSPLFQVWMDYRPFNPDYRPTMFGGEASGTPTVGRTGYDLTLDVEEIDGTDIRVSFRTQKYLYSASSTRRLFDSYMRLVKAFATSFETHVHSVPLWNHKEIDTAKGLGLGE